MADRAYRNAVLLDNYRGPKGPMPNLFSRKGCVRGLGSDTWRAGA